MVLLHWRWRGPLGASDLLVYRRRVALVGLLVHQVQLGRLLGVLWWAHDKRLGSRGLRSMWVRQKHLGHLDV